ncbi:hypothetical protein JL721_7022 [Aureococcus anophagefferens]|nr:hypothetical protein JL721_7022 [Aureococcus anophagefferens]
MPNQVTRARRRRLDNLSRLETDLADSAPSAPPARVSDDAAAVGPTRWTVHAGEQSGWRPPPPPASLAPTRATCRRRRRVRSITIDEAELTLSPHARAFSMPEPAPAVTPDGSPRLAGFHRSRPPSPPPFSLAPPAEAARTRGDGRLVGTVVHLSRKLCGTFDTVDEDGVAVTRFNGWYGFVRPDESTLRDEGFCRGDLFLHPSATASFHLGVHDRRLKAADLRPVSDDSDEDGSATASRSRRDSWDSRDGSPRPGPSRSWDAESSPRAGLPVLGHDASVLRAPPGFEEPRIETRRP